MAIKRFISRQGFEASYNLSATGNFEGIWVKVFLGGSLKLSLDYAATKSASVDYVFLA